MKRGKLIRQIWISRDDVRQNRDRVYVFGDNMERVGMGGQAASMRGEPNTVGIPTKWRPSMSNNAFFTDDDLDVVMPTINREFQKLQGFIREGTSVVIPSGGLGTGLSDLPVRAPRVLEYIEGWIEALQIESTM